MSNDGQLCLRMVHDFMVVFLVAIFVSRLDMDGIILSKPASPPPVGKRCHGYNVIKMAAHSSSRAVVLSAKI